MGKKAKLIIKTAKEIAKSRLLCSKCKSQSVYVDYVGEEEFGECQECGATWII